MAPRRFDLIKKQSASTYIKWTMWISSALFFVGLRVYTAAASPNYLTLKNALNPTFELPFNNLVPGIHVHH